MSSQVISAIPGTYTITAAPVVVGTSTYNAMLPTQTVVVDSGNATSAIVDYKNVVPATSKVLDSVATNSLSISSDGLTLTMSASSPVAHTLTVGDVIVVPPTPTSGVAPMGMLRKVVSIDSGNSQIVAITQPGKLSDAFQRVGFQVQTQLQPGTIQTVHTSPGVTFRPSGVISRSLDSRLLRASPQALTDPCGGYSLGVFDVSKDFQIDAEPGLTLRGSVEVCSGLNFAVDIIGTGFLGLQPKVNSLTATASMGESSNLTLEGDLLTGSFDPDPVQLATLEFFPIEVPGLPVWVTPQVSVFVGAKGSISSGISTEVSSSGTFTGGVTYSSGTWSPVPLSPSFQFAYQPPTLNASLSAKAYAGIDFSLYVYDIVGPSFKPDGYLDLEADISKNPWWTLSSGIEGPMSLDVSFLGESLASYDLGTMFNYSDTIASASGPFLSNNPIPAITPPLVPASLPAGSSAQTLTINGSGFLSTSTVTYNGQVRAAAYVSATQITIALTASDLATAGNFPVIVTNPSPGGGASNVATFIVTAPSTAISISPASVTVPAGGVQTFTATVAGGGGVTWSIQEGAVGGTITTAGIYTATIYTAPYHIVATEVADPTKSAVATVTVVAGPAVTTLHSFDHTKEGALPWAALIFGDDGYMYGTTVGGGNLSCTYSTSIHGCGTIYKIDTSGNSAVLHTFSGQDGLYPGKSLIQTTNGTLFGITQYGGLNMSQCTIGGTAIQAGCGTIFSTGTSGSFSNLASFGPFSSPIGVGPVAALMQSQSGTFYGTTYVGGSTTCGGMLGTLVAKGCGSIFSFSGLGAPAAAHTFSGAEGAYPATTLLQGSDGNFYGTTTGGGTLTCSSYGSPGCGTVFKMASTGSVTTLHAFTKQDGASPQSSLILGNDGSMYGSAIFGGTTSCSGGAQWSGCGTIFKIDASGNFTLLHSFSGPDGAYPATLLLGADGYFYGTTESGGSSSCIGRYGPGCGTIFRMDAAGNITVIYAFTGQSDGSWPESALIQGTDGNLYGTAVYGGTNDDGVVFRVSDLSSLSSNSTVQEVQPEVRPAVMPSLTRQTHLGLPLPTVTPHP